MCVCARRREGRERERDEGLGRIDRDEDRQEGAKMTDWRRSMQMQDGRKRESTCVTLEPGFIKFIELGPWGDTSPYEMKTNKQQEGKNKTFIKKFTVITRFCFAKFFSSVCPLLGALVLPFSLISFYNKFIN